MDKKYQILKRQRPWREAYFYQKADTLYQLTCAFCKRFLPLYGDRTVDQMVQAARSGKQNIIEGCEDGVTSTEMQLKLINVARASLHELREDYRDYLLSHHKEIWSKSHPRYEAMQDFCRSHNKLEDFMPFFDKWTDEEMANTAYTLCFMTDAMLNSHLKGLEEEFVKDGGIKERMHSARTGYRKEVDAKQAVLTAEISRLRNEVVRLKEILKNNKIEY